MRQNRSGYVNKYRIYKSRQSIRPQSISCFTGFLYCIITDAVTELPKKEKKKFAQQMTLHVDVCLYDVNIARFRSRKQESGVKIMTHLKCDLTFCQLKHFSERTF